MKRVSDISSPAEFSIEIQRELLRDWRLNRWAKVVLVVCACLAMADEASARLLALVLFPF